MRKLKYHEKKILKKVDFVNWKHNIKEVIKSENEVEEKFISLQVGVLTQNTFVVVVVAAVAKTSIKAVQECG